MKKAELIEKIANNKQKVLRGSVRLADPIGFYNYLIKELENLDPEPPRIEGLKCWICGRTPKVDEFDALYRFVTYETDDKKINSGLECRKHAEF